MSAVAAGTPQLIALASQTESSTEDANDYAELAQLAGADVKALLDEELAAIDELIGNSDD